MFIERKPGQDDENAHFAKKMKIFDCSDAHFALSWS